MMFIASFIVFMLAHRHAVCDELYPISVVIDIAQKEPEWATDDVIEPLQQTTNDAAIPALNLPLGDDEGDLKLMKTKIVDKYKFVKDAKRDIWTYQPDFKGHLGTPEFVAAADWVKKFFVRNNDWESTKRNPDFRTAQSCINLLYITAARYLFVTHVLYVQSGGKLQPCVSTPDKKITIPDSGVCYPAPYGSATCTSDYDVGLVGKDAGFLTEKFNQYFQGAQGFGKPSELVFDTNVYAFTLEYAMPFLFVKLPGTFATGVEKNEQTINFKMQELASAYYKVFKYNENFFHTLVNEAKEAMTRNATKSKTRLDAWLTIFQNMNAEVPMKPEGALKSPKAFRTAHNNEYQKLVKAMSVAGYNKQLLGDLAKALIYAAEAYHTRGAIRHVVGVTQMKIVSLKTALTTQDLWVSMIENWGEANKEYNHCGRIPLEECFLKMTKYMWRVFNAMRLIRERLPPKARPGLVHFGEKFRDPEFAMKMWLDYKKQGKTAIPQRRSNVKDFLAQFGCDRAVFGRPFSPTCISKMNGKVNAYNKKLAGLVTDEPVKPPWRP